MSEMKAEIERLQSERRIKLERGIDALRNADDAPNRDDDDGDDDDDDDDPKSLWLIPKNPVLQPRAWVQALSELNQAKPPTPDPDPSDDLSDESGSLSDDSDSVASGSDEDDYPLNELDIGTSNAFRLDIVKYLKIPLIPSTT